MPSSDRSALRVVSSADGRPSPDEPLHREYLVSSVTVTPNDGDSMLVGLTFPVIPPPVGAGPFTDYFDPEALDDARADLAGEHRVRRVSLIYSETEHREFLALIERRTEANLSQKVLAQLRKAGRCSR